jgi:hypothetical protein
VGFVTRDKLARMRRGICVAAIAVVPISMLALTSSAEAVEHHPKGEYAVFADCPLSNSATEACLLAKTESGEFQIAKEKVPIVSTITLQGGLHNTATGQTFIGAEDGNTLSKTPQKVPGGLAGLVKCPEIENFIERILCEAIFENGLTGVNATTELAAPATSIGISVENLLNGTGIALSLPVKVHLENPLLGSSCYIGSNSKPIVIELTTGTTSPPPPNKPITGSVGELEFNPAFTIVTIKKNALVNNSYAAPKAEGCGAFGILNSLVNGKLGLPSAAGSNSAILKGTLKTAEASAVKASE